MLGFTRIEAPEMDPTMEVFNEEQGVSVSPAPLSARELNWLPAVENLGEGVFLRLNPERLATWEAREDVVRHSIKCRSPIKLRRRVCWPAGSVRAT